MDKYFRDIHILYYDEEVSVVRALEGRIDIYPHKIECVDVKSNMKTTIVLPFNQRGVSIKID